jgi:glycosyltransferase involved in cell wall biosynthesis
LDRKTSYKKRGTYMISIIMPVLNRKRYISFAIESVLQQTYTKWELIILDGRSTDGTLEIIKQYIAEKRYHQITLHKQDKKEWPGVISRARNKGINLSKGEYIAFLDSDDLWKAEKLEKQYKFLQENDLDMLFSNIGIIDENGRIIKNKSVPLKNYSNLRKTLFIRNIIPTSTILIKKKVLLRSGKFSEDRYHAEDYDLWLKIAFSGYKIGFINESLGYWRWHQGNNSGLLFQSEYDSERTISEHLLSIFPEAFKYLSQREAFLLVLKAKEERKKNKYLSAFNFYFKSILKYPLPIKECNNRFLRAVYMIIKYLFNLKERRFNHDNS